MKPQRATWLLAVLLALAGGAFYPVSSTGAPREASSLVWVDAAQSVERTTRESTDVPANPSLQPLRHVCVEPAGTPAAGLAVSLFQRPPPSSPFVIA